LSAGRAGPHGSGGFTAAQIEQIRRTVRRTSEVMVKVTGGGATVGAVRAHVSYISQHGELRIATDEGQRVAHDSQNALLKDWHLERSAGQYREPRGQKKTSRTVKLVHNVVLSMPAPTPPEKVLAAARIFAREKFGLKHRYAMAPHTHQQHPHVHLVIKAESEAGRRRLHIDKALLREWRENFARMMRDQGIAANATSRAVRGHSKRAVRDAAYRAKGRASSHAMREQLQSIARELSKTGTIRDPAHSTLAPKGTVVSGQFWLLPARHAVRPSARSIPLRSSCQRRLPSAASSVFARPESKRVTHEAKLKKSFSPSNFPASVGSTVEKPIVHPAKSLSKIGSRMISVTFVWRASRLIVV
jgi:hypothetical protein